MNRASVVGGILFVSISAAWCGGIPYEVLVAVNASSRNSVLLGSYYARCRGIPPDHILRLRSPTTSEIDRKVFERNIRDPIERYIRKHAWGKQIRYIVFSMDFPYRVYGNRERKDANSLTAAMAYGYHKSPPPCSLPLETRSDYYAQEQDFDSYREHGGRIRYLCTMLAGWDLDQARGLVDSSIAADKRQPTGRVYFVRTSDADRNRRWPMFAEAACLLRLGFSPITAVITSATEIAGATDVVGYMLGNYMPQRIASNKYQPGALADHFTSWGGYLLDSGWQMSILDWVSNGCAGTYGTVVEPCSYVAKFPDPRVYYWYSRGFNLAESYWMAVANPYQGLIIGDPLCAPYCRNARIFVRRTAGHQHVVDSRGAIEVDAVAADERHPLDRLDLFIDGVFRGTITNVPFEPDERVCVVIGGTTNEYMLTGAEDLSCIATALSARINRNCSGVSAFGYGDRIELKLKNPRPGIPPPDYAAFCRNNGDEDLTTYAWAAGSRFITPPYRAWQRVLINGKAADGDRIVVRIRRLDGVEITNRVTCKGGEGSMSFLRSLQSVINHDKRLQGVDGCEVGYVQKLAGGRAVELLFVSRTNTWLGCAVGIDIQVLRSKSGKGGLRGGYHGFLVGNLMSLLPRGMVYLAHGRRRLHAVYPLPEGILRPSGHSITVVAHEGTASRGTSIGGDYHHPEIPSRR